MVKSFVEKCEYCGHLRSLLKKVLTNLLINSKRKVTNRFGTDAPLINFKMFGRFDKMSNATLFEKLQKLEKQRSFRKSLT